MENVIEWLREARGEIIAGLVFALLGWLYSRYRSFMKMYRLKKKELERMENEMFRFGNSKKEIESLQEALKESEAQRQDVQNQLETLQQELQRKDEALRESEAKSQEASRRIEALQSQLETSQTELQRRGEALKESEAQRQDVQNQLETLQQELQRKNKAESEQQPELKADILLNQLAKSNRELMNKVVVKHNTWVNELCLVCNVLNYTWKHEKLLFVLSEYIRAIPSGINKKEAMNKAVLVFFMSMLESTPLTEDDIKNPPVKLIPKIATKTPSLPSRGQRAIELLNDVLKAYTSTETAQVESAEFLNEALKMVIDRQK